MRLSTEKKINDSMHLRVASQHVAFSCNTHRFHH
jgi:hypothetical protein